MSTSPGAKAFGTEELLFSILSLTDRKSLINVMISCRQGLCVGVKIFWRESSTDMMVKLGSLMCPPNRLALYCDAVRRVSTSVPRPDGDSYAQLIGPFPHATKLVGVESRNVRPRYGIRDDTGDVRVTHVFQITAIPHPTSRALLSTSYHSIHAKDSQADFHLIPTSNLSEFHLHATRGTYAEWNPFLYRLRASPLLLSKLRSLNLGREGAAVSHFGSWLPFLKDVPLLELSVSIDFFQLDFLARLSCSVPTLEHLRIRSISLHVPRASFEDLLVTMNLPELRELDLKVALQMNGSRQYPIPIRRQPALPFGNLQKLSMTVMCTPETSLLREALCLSRFIPTEYPVVVDPWQDFSNGKQVQQWSDLLAKERRALSYARISSGGWCQLSKEAAVKNE